jgi:hypothetical protein
MIGCCDQALTINKKGFYISRTEPSVNKESVFERPPALSRLTVRWAFGGFLKYGKIIVCVQTNANVVGFIHSQSFQVLWSYDTDE